MATKGAKMWEAYKNQQPIEQTPAVNTGNKGYDEWQNYRATYVRDYNESLERAKPGLNYVNSFLRDVNSFYNQYGHDSQEPNYSFNAADFFEERKKQAEDLKSRRSDAERYLDENRSFYTDTEYQNLMDSLASFDTDIDNILSYYQNVSSAKSGMQNYQNEYAAYLEEQAGKQKAMYDAAAVLGMDSPAAAVLFQIAGDFGFTPDKRGITDQWTDEQRYILGSLQNEDPIEAMKYARNVNKGQDPYQVSAANEQEEMELLALDLNAAKRDLEQLEREYWSYSYDSSTPMGERAGQQALRRMEQEIDQKQQIINRAQLIQDRQRLGAVSGNADFATQSLYQEGNTDPVYAYVNNVDGARGYMDRAHNPAIKGAYDQMTADEVANYNYHYATGGKEQAQRYLDTITETLNERKAGQMYQKVKGKTGQEMLFAAGVGLNQAAEGFQNNFSNADYIAPSAYQIAGGMVREELAGTGMQLPEFLGGGSLGQVGYDLINTAANMAPSMAIGALNPIAGTLAMGASAAGNAYQEALNQGYSKEQARTYSALVGASETGLEYLMGGISSLGGVIPGGIVEKMLDGVDNAFKRFAIEMGGSMIGEGFEEGLQEVLTPYFQNLALGANEDVNWNEVAYSALLGALSGGVMEAPGTAINAATYSLRNRPSTGAYSSGSAPSTPALTERDIQSKVAQDGKDRIISSNESVDALDFDSIANGEATIQLSDGRTAPMEDMNWADQDKATRFMVVRSLPGIETEAANDLYHAMTENNSGSDIDTVVGIRDAYSLGYNGFDKTDASRYGRDSSKLSPALRTAAFEAGRKQMEADAAAAPKLSQTSVNKIQGKSVKPADGYKKVVFEGKVKLKNNPKAKAEVRFMDYIAEKFSGTTVHVYQSYKGKDGKYYYRDVYGNRKEAPNGKYVGDEIWIDLNSGDKGEGLVLNTFAHEMYHHVEKWNKKGAQKLAGFVVKELGLKDVESAVDAQIKKAEAAGYGVEYWKKHGNNGKGMTEEQAINMVQQRAMSDFVADSLETMFSRGDAAETIARLKEEDRGLFDKIKEFIDQWVSTLKQWYSDKTISEEGKKVAQLERFEELQKLFLESVEEAGANYNAALEMHPVSQKDIKSVIGEDGQYSLRNAPEDIHTVRKGLADTFDELVKTNPNMKRYADEYRQKAAEVQVAEGNLKSVRQQIQELSKSRNPKDQKQLKTLRAEAISLHNRVNNLNKRLMRIEGYKLFSDAAKDASKSYKNAMLQQMKNQQAENIQQQLLENRVVREELTGMDSDITIMEKEFIRIVKKYEQLDAKTGKKITDLRNALKSEADSHREESRVWQMEFNRLLREYETSGRKIERLEATIARQRATAKAMVQSRRNTEMRNKIQRRASELDRMLRNGTKTSYVPEGLREPVAAILEAIDLRKSDKETKVAQHLRDLRLAYYDIRSNSDPNIRSIFDEGLSDHLETLTKEVGDTKLGDMTTYQLEAVYDILTAVLETVRNANEAFAESKKAKISEMSDAAMRQIRSYGKEKYRGKMDSDFVKGLKAFMWNDMRPVDIFEAIGSSEMMNLFRNIRKGEDVWAKDIQEARDFFRQQWQKHKGDDWDMTQQHTFTSASGMDFRLSLDQIMSIYALFRRDKDQAMAHLRQGGFVFDNNVVDKKGKSHTDATAYNLTDDTILRIIGTLNADQMAFVESMQGYLSDTMGAKGNEVSMKLYGIKLFREKNYFPIRSAEQYMERAKAQQRGEVKIKNSGFTKPVTPNANTPIVLSSFMDVWGSHVDEMSNYHAFVLPMEDMYRVYNYRTDISNEESASRSVQAAIQNAYGEGAVKAIDQLLKDINGGVRSDSTAGFLNKLISRYKKGATMASLSVAAQQPSAIMRAAAMIDWKYFVGPKPTAKMTGRTWDEIKKHAPIAIIKEIGGFDTNTGRVASEFLTKMEYQGFEEQFKAFFEDGQFRDDVLGRLPAWADEISWGVIWNAVKREQKSHYPNMDVTSDAFLNKVAERFTDVIIHTQVYDSVLAKNAMMRSKDTGMKMVTSFMAEPTVTANMLASAITRAIRKGDKAGAKKTISAVVAATLFNAAASSVVYALRDDDEDERYDEKWIASFMENLLESANPMGYIPLLRDANNILAGYDIERADMSIVSDFAEAVKSLGNEDMSDWEKVEKFAGAVANVFGVPLKNVTRDLKGIWNTLRTRFGAKNTATRTGYYMAATGKNMSDGEQLLLAIRRDDQKHFERVAGRFDDQKSAESALKTTIGTHYKDGSMTAEEAKELLMTYAGMEEDDVYWKLDEWNFAMDNDSSDDYAKYNSLHAAIDSGAGFEAEIDRHLEHGAEPDEIRAQISRVYHKAYLEASEDEREQIREKVTPAYLYAGMDEDALEAKFNDWDFEAEYGMTYSEYKAGYLDDSVSRVELEDAMKFYGRKNYQIADDIRSLDKDKKFRAMYDMSLSEMKDAYNDGDVSRNQLINALVFNGMTQKEASQEVTQRDIRNRLGIDYMELDDAYKHGDISRQTFYNAMIENGATRVEADEAILGYDWLKKHVKNHPDLAISDAKKFAVSLGDNAEGYTLEDFGVSIEAYKEYKQKLPDCQGVDANGDGKTDSGTKRDAILRMIDSLPISDEAKEGLALMSYSKSSIRKNAPWH